MVHDSIVYLTAAIIVFFIIIVNLILFKKKKREISWLLNIAMILAVSGMFFENRLIAYSLMGTGIILIILDLILKRKKKVKIY